MANESCRTKSSSSLSNQIRAYLSVLNVCLFEPLFFLLLFLFEFEMRFLCVDDLTDRHKGVAGSSVVLNTYTHIFWASQGVERHRFRWLNRNIEWEISSEETTMICLWGSKAPLILSLFGKDAFGTAFGHDHRMQSFYFTSKNLPNCGSNLKKNKHKKLQRFCVSLLIWSFDSSWGANSEVNTFSLRITDRIGVLNENVTIVISFDILWFVFYFVLFEYIAAVSPLSKES